MCFSASASFTASAVLVTIGAYCLKKAYDNSKKYLMLSGIPLLFGLQQFCEGLVWLSFGKSALLTHVLALCFLFFAYFLWPIWMPIAAYQVEPKIKRKNLLKINIILSTIFSMAIYIPLLINRNWLQVTIYKHHIFYDMQFLFGLRHHFSIVLILYTLLGVGAYFLSSIRKLNIFGVLLFTSLIFSLFIYLYTFVSNWCFFSALLSLYLAYVIDKASKNTNQ